MKLVLICYISALLYAFDIQFSEISVIFAQFELIADPYRFPV